MYKRLMLVAMFCLLSIACTYACTGNNCNKDSNVGDVNDGNKGYIFTYECEKGNESLGKWVDPSSVSTLKGDKGDAGAPGANGKNGTQGEQGLTGKEGTSGKEGKDGVKGEPGLQGLQGKGLKDQYKVGIELRLLDTKRTTWSVYYNRDFNNQINEVGIKCTIKLGKSYTDRKIEELEKRLIKAGL